MVQLLPVEPAGWIRPVAQEGELDTVTADAENVTLRLRRGADYPQIVDDDVESGWLCTMCYHMLMFRGSYKL